MPGPVDYLEEVGEIITALRDLGLEPVLVGGMALVMLGSRRVTRDFDFVVGQPGDRLERAIDVFYDRGLELAARLSDGGEVISTIRSRRVASIRLRLDAPASAYFFNPQTSLRVGYLFCSIIPSPRPRSPAARRKPKFALVRTSRCLGARPSASQEDRQGSTLLAG